MKVRRLVAAAVAILAIATSTPKLQAAVLTYQVPFSVGINSTALGLGNGGSVGNGAYVNNPYFDKSLGVLTAVAASATITTHQEAFVPRCGDVFPGYIVFYFSPFLTIGVNYGENLATANSDVHVYSSPQISYVPDGSAQYISEPVTVSTQSLIVEPPPPNYSGRFPWDISGLNFWVQYRGLNPFLRNNFPSQLENFKVNGEVRGPVLSIPQFNDSDNVNGTLTLTYTYTPIPEPASIATFGVVGAACLIRRRRAGRLVGVGLRPCDKTKNPKERK